jgi:hypothetical protein
MQLLASITEDDMVLAFLQAELNSSRFRHLVMGSLEKNGCAERLITHPDMCDQRELELRRRVLDYRGYASRQGAFYNFPTDVVWARAELTSDELGRVRFARMKFWDNLSEGTRSPAVAAETVRLRRGWDRFNQWDLACIEAMRVIAHGYDDGQTVPPVILLGTVPDGDLVIFEGYTRVTAWFLADCPRVMPPVVVGLSSGFGHLLRP